MPRIRIQALFDVIFDHLALKLQAFLGQIHQMPQPLKKFFLGFGQITKARHIDRDHADGTGQRARAEQSAAAAVVQFGQIQPQTAAHRAHILGIHVRIDVVGEIVDAVLGRGFPHRLHVRVVPVKILGDADRRDRERENALVLVAFHHHFVKSAIEHIHLFLKIAVGFVLRFAADDHRLLGE